MDVHHHPHPEKKGLKEYILEGLMIFIAVSLGFVAETMREHISENSKARELAVNLYKEIYSDSITVAQKVAARIIKEKQSDYFIRYVKDSSLDNLSPQFYPAFTFTFINTNPILFEPKDGILSQLRNSGMLRFFKSPELQDEIGQLSVLIANVKSRNDVEYNFLQSYARELILEHYDFNWYDAYNGSGLVDMTDAPKRTDTISVKPVVLNAKTFNRARAASLAAYYRLIFRATRIRQYANYADMNHQLLRTLRQEYHFDPE